MVGYTKKVALLRNVLQPKYRLRAIILCRNAAARTEKTLSNVGGNNYANAQQKRLPASRPDEVIERDSTAGIERASRPSSRRPSL